jgi:DNA invertase Pin-like site-specific DNA recombinase
MGKRVILYVRMSTEEQAKTGLSLADQERKLERHVCPRDSRWRRWFETRAFPAPPRTGPASPG